MSTSRRRQSVKTEKFVSCFQGEKNHRMLHRKMTIPTQIGHWERVEINASKRYRVKYFAQMIGVCISYVGAQYFIASITFEAALYVSSTESPNGLTGNNAKQQIISSGCVLRSFRRSHWPIVQILIR